MVPYGCTFRIGNTTSNRRFKLNIEGDKKLKDKPQHSSCYFPLENLQLLKSMREITVFEHSQYGRIVAAAFDSVLIIVIS